MTNTRTKRGHWIAALVVTALGCASPGLDVDEVLIDGFSPEDQATTLLMPLAAFDVAATATRERAAEPDASLTELVAASRCLFQAADAREQSSALAALDALEEPTLAQVLGVSDDTSESTRAEVEALTREGARFAERALGLAGDDADALIYHGLNTVLLAWAVGSQRALFEGLGGACKDTTAAALEAAEEHGSGAALRLRGRFLSKAPWPVGDRAEGLRLLRRSVEVAPVLLNWLFLGDALHASGDQDAALEAWQRAVDAEPDEDSVTLAGYHRELARRRLAASRR